MNAFSIFSNREFMIEQMEKDSEAVMKRCFGEFANVVGKAGSEKIDKMFNSALDVLRKPKMDIQSALMPLVESF